jgi:hypothetical protein
VEGIQIDCTIEPENADAPIDERVEPFSNPMYRRFVHTFTNLPPTVEKVDGRQIELEDEEDERSN